MLYTLIKAVELMIVVAVCHSCCRHRDASWQSVLRILAFPVCVLCISVYLFFIMMEEPQYAAELLSCMMLLLAADIACRMIVSPIVLPIGALTSFMGAPLFLYLILRQRRSR